MTLDPPDPTKFQENEPLLLLIQIRNELVPLLTSQQRSLLSAQSEVDDLRRDVNRLNRVVETTNALAHAPDTVLEISADNERLMGHVERLLLSEIDGAHRLETSHLQCATLLQRIGSLELNVQRLGDQVSSLNAEVLAAREDRDRALARGAVLAETLAVIFSSNSWRISNGLRSLFGRNPSSRGSRGHPTNPSANPNDRPPS